MLILGIDGGATKVSAWEVIMDRDSKTFMLDDLNEDIKYSSIPGFIDEYQPVPVADQLTQRDNKEIDLETKEIQQGTVLVEACAQAIEKIVKQKQDNKILVGIGMPGLKTEDRRGIAVVANGPRVINYCSMLEERLQSSQIEFVAPVHHLGSDADYCGIGENYSSLGKLRETESAYYLGGGTGVADALKIKGSLVPFDDIKPWMAKTWELKMIEGYSMEKYCSAGGFQSIYAEQIGKSVGDLNKQGIYPIQITEKAAQNEPAAKKVLEQIVNALALLLFSRASTLYSGWKNTFEFVNPNKPALTIKHEFHGTLLDRFVIAQRLGDILKTESGKNELLNPTIERFKKLLVESDLPEEFRNHYQNFEKLITPSDLREAPALGAGIDAFFSWQDFQ